ncbi:MAG: magnesium/cobalt transporter CorA [Terriglobia bacterium]
MLDQLAQACQFHELEVEDCRHAGQRAKMEEYEDHVFVIANTLHFMQETLGVWSGELDIFVGADFVVTVHVGPTRSVHDVVPRVKANAKLQRPDKVLHALLDNIVDRYPPVLDTIGDRIDELEDEVWADPTAKCLSDIFALKRGLIEFRRTVATMREMINTFLRLRPPYLRADMAAYWRDIYDHVVRAFDLIDTYRDRLTGLLDVHLSATANRTNSIMKALTVFATIVLPLYLISGYFGMNFPNLPLLNHPYGIAIINGVMVVLAGALLLYFRWRRWL